MATYVYACTALTGGTTTALDYIDGDDLNDGDLAMVVASSKVYFYELNATSGAAESSPDIISPDTNYGDKRWILQEIYADALTLVDDLAVTHGGTGSSTAAAARTALGVEIGSDVQAYDAGLLSIAGLTTAADKMIYTTASDTYAAVDLTSAGRAILDDADAAAQRTTLGLTDGATTDVDLAELAIDTGLVLKSVEASSGTLTGTSDTIEVNIPSGALIHAIAMNNDLAVTDDDGDDTYTAAFSGGNTVTINGGTAIAAAVNTKTTEFLNTGSNDMSCSSETDITLTPNGTNFTAGDVTARVYYWTLADLADAAT